MSTTFSWLRRPARLWLLGVPVVFGAHAVSLLLLYGAGKIRRWGVSNFDVDDLEELGGSVGGCATDQVLYNLEARGIEFDLLPWSQQRQMPVMAYSPVGQGGRLLKHPALAVVARR